LEKFVLFDGMKPLPGAKSTAGSGSLTMGFIASISSALFL